MPWIGVAAGSKSSTPTATSSSNGWQRGSGDGLFGNARGLAADSQGNVYVADTNNHRIQKFTSSGVFMIKWGSLGYRQRAVQSTLMAWLLTARETSMSPIPTIIASRNSPLAVCIRAKWGSYGTGNGQFQFPGGVAVDSRGRVYVTDLNNNRIQQFTSSGTFLAKWDSLRRVWVQISLWRGRGRAGKECLCDG